MTEWHGGKGSKMRPTDTKKFNDNWDAIFGKKESEVWQHYCKNNGHMAITKGESCNWCGMKEDGSLD